MIGSVSRIQIKSDHPTTAVDRELNVKAKNNDIFRRHRNRSLVEHQHVDTRM